MTLYADLHIHTCFSDGTMSPEEIAKKAAEAGVGLIAVTDHNMLEGSRLAIRACEHRGVHCIPAVELDSMDGSNGLHILAYGVDLDDIPFSAFVSKSRRLLDLCSDRLVSAMEADYPSLSTAAYEAFVHDRRMGGWKALQYLLTNGVTTRLKEGIPFYEKYRVGVSSAGFPPVEQVCHSIKAAGGYAVLAHPGESLKFNDSGELRNELRRLADCGIDGIECYYPTHGAEITKACLEVCRQMNLLITSGSDFHGAFSGAEIGAMRMPVEELRLGGLV